MTATEALAHFPADGASAGGARRFVAATLAAWQLDQLEEVACLLVSELVSNVVLHAATELDLHIRRSDGRVRVEVHDGDVRLPERKFYSPTSTTGRGLVFLAELAQGWGADPTPSGKVVWFELDETPPPVVSPHAVGAEFNPDDWEDWDDLPSAQPTTAPQEGEAGRHEATTSARRQLGPGRLVGVR